MLIIVDYADLLRGHGQEKRHELEGIYEDLRGMAGEYEYTSMDCISSK